MPASRTPPPRRSLRGRIYRSESLDGADFSNTDLRGARFEYASLRESTFAGADLRAVDFLNCDLAGASLENVLLGGNRFDGSRLTDVVGLSDEQADYAVRRGASVATDGTARKRRGRR